MSLLRTYSEVSTFMSSMQSSTVRAKGPLVGCMSSWPLRLSGLGTLPPSRVIRCGVGLNPTIPIQVRM